MRSRRFGRAVIVSVLSLSIAGCAADGQSPFSTYNDTSDLTPAERRLREDNRVFNETILGGVAFGALTGATLGALAGALTGRTDNIWKGAAIGAAAGGITGGLDGWKVAVRQEASRKQVREIDLATDMVLEENRKIQSSISNMDAVIDDTRGSLRNARSARQAGTGSEEEVRRQEARTAKNIELMDELIEKHEERLEEQEEIGDSYRNDGQRTVEIENDIRRTRELLEQKKRERDLLEEELVQGTA